MDDKYLNTMQTKENLCLAYMQKADDLFEENGQRHTKEECVYLQKAATLRYEMSQISLGEERRYQQRKVQELNQRIKKIIQEVKGSDSDENKSVADAAGAKKPGSASSTSGTASSGKKSSAGGPTDDVVNSWFKEAPKHSFEDVSGMNDLKEQLRESIADSQLTDLTDYLEMKNLHSYFFIGPPGCGKTYIIEAFAHELMDQNYKYLALVGADILSRYVGEAEKIITRLFEEAENNAPCIVFIDEVDGVCKNRSQPNLPEYAASLTTSFLTGYNRINSSDKPIIFIGATNYPNQVDNAMLDRVELIRVPFPDQDARKSAFKRQFKKILMLEDGFTYDDMAVATVSYNYRDIDRLCARIKTMVKKDTISLYDDQKRAVEVLKSGEYRLTQEMFEEAQASCLPTPKEDIIRELDEWEAKFKAGLEE